MIEAIWSRVARVPARLKRHGATRVETDPVLETQAAISAALSTLSAPDAGIAIRDLHGILGVSQPRVLKAVEALQRTGVIEVEETLHDPLGSIIRLSSR